jgi:hypothetical protein
MTCVRTTAAGTCLSQRAIVATVAKTEGYLVFLLEVADPRITDDIRSKPGDMDDKTTSP